MFECVGEVTENNFAADREKTVAKNDYFYLMNNFRKFIEVNLFGVCTWLGERMGVATSKIRMWFIYISFLTFGSPVIVYMVIAFWMNLKKYVLFSKRNPLRYL